MPGPPSQDLHGGRGRADPHLQAAPYAPVFAESLFASFNDASGIFCSSLVTFCCQELLRCGPKPQVPVRFRHCSQRSLTGAGRVGCRGVRPAFPASAAQPPGAERWPCQGGLCGGLGAGSAWTRGPPGDEDPLRLAEQSPLRLQERHSHHPAFYGFYCLMCHWPGSGTTLSPGSRTYNLGFTS